ncbi:DUF2975 domain-containing protein [Ulvibacter antarcticus]|uniref:DUF2975 family protein n=1 Tax=Ulvibacter antarcticus TaxID=442714 RepID=A0A3L9YYG2_9FLAO|nr:DUF2975 domain-containing protein [Ulvibacter antarcticus]RMA65771.1 Protein of unknown function (DUF2975) [Ulvibacter antarcticus]
MKSTTTPILSLLKVISWIIFIGLLIQAGAILTSFTISLFNPIAAQNLYLGLDLSELYNLSLWYYICSVSFYISFLIIQAYIAYLVIQVFAKLNLQQPFSEAISLLISKISHAALTAGLLAVIAQGYTKWLSKTGLNVIQDWGSSEFLFLAAIIFIIAQVFKRGIELQAENTLTI